MPNSGHNDPRINSDNLETFLLYDKSNFLLMKLNYFIEKTVKIKKVIFC